MWAVWALAFDAGVGVRWRGFHAASLPCRLCACVADPYPPAPAAHATHCRDDARAVLVSMSRELGPDYLPFVCDVLRSALPLRGYTAQVRAG